MIETALKKNQTPAALIDLPMQSEGKAAAESHHPLCTSLNDLRDVQARSREAVEAVYRR